MGSIAAFVEEKEEEIGMCGKEWGEWRSGRNGGVGGMEVGGMEEWEENTTLALSTMSKEQCLLVSGLVTT